MKMVSDLIKASKYMSIILLKLVGKVEHREKYVESLLQSKSHVHGKFDSLVMRNLVYRSNVENANTK